MTKKLIWRLGKLPSAEEIRELVKDKILTQDEAREILFSEKEENDRDVDSLKSEIKFLKDLVDRLSNQGKIIETIKVIEKHYRDYPWYQPYNNWVLCSSSIGNNSLVGSTATNAVSNQYVNTSNSISAYASGFTKMENKFNSIKTF